MATHDHGNTAAAWTAVTIMLIGTVVAGLGLVGDSGLTFGLGLAAVAVGAVVGKIMQMMGLGKQPA